MCIMFRPKCCTLSLLLLSHAVQTGAFLRPLPLFRLAPLPSTSPTRPLFLPRSPLSFTASSAPQEGQAPSVQSSPPSPLYDQQEGGWSYFHSVPRALPGGRTLREDRVSSESGEPFAGEEEGERGRQRRRLVLYGAQGEREGDLVFVESRGKSLHLETLQVKEGDATEGGGEAAAATLSPAHSLILGAMERFLNRGGRIGQVTVGDAGQEGRGLEPLQASATALGFRPIPPEGAPAKDKGQAGRPVLQGGLTDVLPELQALSRDTSASGSALLLNVLGRLEHDAQNFKAASDLYTQALTLQPNSSTIFQNLGAAFASQGEHQLAFASFQRAIDLNANDRYTYFKLGMMYEQLATGKYKEAAEHALSCYAFYVDGREGGEDTDALTIYGNLLVKRLCPAEAVEVYKRALALEAGLWNVWFNMANAYLKIGEKEDAIIALQQTLSLNPNVSAARHLLLSITGAQGGGEGGAAAPVEADPAYVVELFDYYAPTYDQHMKEGLLYTAPRILRQEVRKVLNHTLFTEGAMGPVTPEGSGEALLRALNKSMRILDLGCGTVGWRWGRGGMKGGRGR
ncbi:tetratricopeptide repeat family protein [Nannochloropsis gaditana]|uniref:Tetratricopeptide repeat family protein n=1 Tax=Nannochloropsis gaditana TaxID=72520 RepID=W7TV59_9STRA|nr:tetratricopeptide repeat family protein [Nannochloropsis gaditana]